VAFAEGIVKRLLLTVVLLAWGVTVACAGAPAAGAPPAASGVHFVYLVRHGTFDRDDHADERTANPLNALGHQQARLVGARLAALHVPFRSLMTSDFLRARQTAADMGAAMHMTPVIDTLIHECTPTPEHPEYTTYHSPEDIALCVSNLEAAWRKYFVPTPGADTWDVLVCHGNVTRWLMLKAMGADTSHWYGPDTANASLTVIAVRPDGTCRLVNYNDTGHLPAGKQTWAGRGMGAAKGKR
jgi:serine/threonine-protein phosphatase PGAM5